jgi:hypothetical protein
VNLYTVGISLSLPEEIRKLEIANNTILDSPKRLVVFDPLPF